MGKNLADIHDRLLKRRTMEVWDDFEFYTSGTTGWTSVVTGSATVAVGDGVGGLVTLSAVDSTDNRDVYIKQTNQLFKYQANTTIIGECYLQYAEANTSAANIIFGFMSSVAANSLVDNGAGPKTSYSGAVIFKVDGGTVWKTQSSISTTQTTNTTATTAGGSSYTRLRIEISPISSTIAEVVYFVDGIQLRDATFNKPIKDFVTYTGAAAMQLFAGLKNGSTTPESMIIDYIAGEELRALFT